MGMRRGLGEPAEILQLWLANQHLARQRSTDPRAMVAHLPAEGQAVIVLGGSHDLTPMLPTGTAYVRVTVRSYPGE